MNSTDGYWNGEPAKFTVHSVVVGDEPADQKAQFESMMKPGVKRFLWFTPFIGHIFQAVKVTQGGQSFFMNNEDGTGLLKVTKGLGSPSYGHRSIYPQEVIEDLPVERWIQYSPDKVLDLERRTNELWMEIDPVGYTEHLKYVKQLLESMAAMKAGTFNFGHGKN